MKLATPQELEEEMQALIRREFVDADSGMTSYLARIFAFMPLVSHEAIEWDWRWLHLAGNEDSREVFGEKLKRSRGMGDKCLVYCTFYREETDGRSGRPGLELARLGQAGYNVAGFYASMLGQEEAPLYPRLSNGFLPIVVTVGPAIFRKYLGDINPPQRAILHTPHGGILLRLRPQYFSS